MIISFWQSEIQSKMNTRKKQGLQKSIAKRISKIAQVLQKLWLILHKFTHGLLMRWTCHLSLSKELQKSIAKRISKIAQVLQKLWLILHKFTHGLLYMYGQDANSILPDRQ